MEENKPKLTVSGYRGIWGKDLNKEITFLYARAFAKLIDKKLKLGNEKKKVVIGHDSRPSYKEMVPVIKEAFEKENIDVLYLGMLPTPTILLAINKLNLDGGIIITASHNPKEYNGLKFVTHGGRITNSDEVLVLQKLFENLTPEEKIFTETNEIQNPIDNKSFRDMHVEEVLKNIDTSIVKSKKFKVALDPINSVGGIITKELLLALDCSVFIINENADGNFAHTPEPLPENLTQIAIATKQNVCDIGFAQDPDADRLVIIDETGEVVREELTVAFAIENIFSRKEFKGVLKNTVVNLSTTRVIDDIALKYQARITRSKVGESNVIEKMLLTESQIGGEGSGGVIFPKVGYMRDSLSGIALVLELLARENKKVSELVQSFPKYFIRKEKMILKGQADVLFQKIKDHFALLGNLNYEDGVRVDFVDKSWIQIRASNTEPFVRIFGEAPTEKRLDELFQEVHLTLGSN